ncbi:MAG: hypothetical protein ACK57U_13210 [Planctomycetota bacterium]
MPIDKAMAAMGKNQPAPGCCWPENASTCRDCDDFAPDWFDPALPFDFLLPIQISLLVSGDIHSPTA